MTSRPPFPHLRPLAALLLVMMLPLLAQSAPLQPGNPPPLPTNPQDMQRPAALPVPQTIGKATTASDALRGKVSPMLQDKAANIHTSDQLHVLIVSVGSLPSNLPLQHRVSRKPDPSGLVFSFGSVAAGNVLKLAAPANVLQVMDNSAVEIPKMPGAKSGAGSLAGSSTSVTLGRTPAEATSSSTQTSNLKPQTSPAAPDSWKAIDIHNVRPAWDAGYHGEGVKVAVVDSGVDFGHPDLQNSYARDENPSSPYYGWPLAYDPWSMEIYDLGIALNNDTASIGWSSSYIDTSYTVMGATAVFSTDRESEFGLTPITHTFRLPGTSKSGIYHIGIHPDENLVYDTFHEYPAVLVVDAHMAGVYDTVITDLNDNYDFTDDDPQYKGHEVATRDYNGDGYADRSAGLLYFIADGHTPIPASDWMYGILPPANGNLVAMMGSFSAEIDHGNFCASDIVAAGRIDGHHADYPPYKPAGSGGMVQGAAPGAKIIAIGNVYRSYVSIYDAYLLMLFGYDGIPNSGDDPQVVNLSFGFSGPTDNGWDFHSRYLSSLLRPFAAQMAVMAATGNGGPGFGTITAPGSSPYVIAVGAATQYGETLTFDPITRTDQILYNDVQPWSNRGPSILGQPKPDVVAVGAWGSGDKPINELAPSGGHDGWNDWEVWGGTSMATPEAVGVMALVYQAYKQANGSFPDSEVARNILKAGAHDLNYDEFAQGAGLVDAGRAVDIAANRYGLYADPSAWNIGSSSAGAIGVITPGQSLAHSFTLYNPSNTPLTANLASDNLVATGSITWPLVTSNTLESQPYTGKRPDYLWDMTQIVPPNTDLMQVTAYFPYQQFTIQDPSSIFLGEENGWSLLVYDWTDLNHDGRAWHDDNHNGVVNTNEYESGELNRFTYGYNGNPILKAWVQSPMQRVHDGLYIGLQHRYATNYITATNVTLQATFYQRQPWSMVQSISPAQLTVPAHGQASFTATFQPPLNQPYGASEGAITVNTAASPGHAAHTQTIPLLANVVAPSLNTRFGGNPPQATSYDTGVVQGGGDWDWRPDSGDWRMFFANNTADLSDNNNWLWTDTQWRDYPTDLDTAVLGPAPWDYFSATQPDLFGSFGMAILGRSQNTSSGTGVWPFQTSTHGTEEWLSSHLNNVQQPHEIIQHNVGYGGKAAAEPFTTTTGIINLNTSNVDISTNAVSGTVPITLTTGMTLPGLSTGAFGLSQKTTEHNLYVVQYGTYFENLTLTNTAALEISTRADNDSDIDLFLDYFNGVRWYEIANSAGGSGNEFIRISPVQDGQYRIRVDGTNVPAEGAHFDLTINSIGGTDLTLSPTISNTIPAGSQVSLSLSWNKPGMTTGIWQGQAFLGPPNAPQLLGIPVTIRFNNPMPEPSETPRPCHMEFADLPTSHWAYDYIYYLYCHNIVGGYLDNTFRPNIATSRAQFAQMLASAEGWGGAYPPSPTFSDVLPWHWAYGAVEELVQHNVVSGYGGQLFYPVRAVSRAEAAKMFVLAAGWGSETPTGPTFSDVPTSHWAYHYIQIAAAHGIFGGYPGGTFHPNASITRAEISKALYLLVTLP